MAKSARQNAEKWSRAMSNAAQSAKDGVGAVTESPTAKAATKLEKARLNYQKAIDSGKMADRLNAVSLSSWKEAYLNKGVNRMVEGARTATTKVEAFQAQLIPYQDSIRAALSSMPDNTPEERKARMLYNFEQMSKFVKAPR